MPAGTRRLALAMCLLTTTGCGSGGGDRPPAGCPESAAQVQAALRQAPGEVRAGGAALSECLTRRGEAAEVQTVGAAYVDAAVVLSDRARRSPEGAAAVRLGYLVGAARRGSGSTQGIHSELVRRLDQELAGVPRSRALRTGIEAGRRSG